MILPIYLYGQPVLKKVAEDIDTEYPNLKELIENYKPKQIVVKTKERERIVQRKKFSALDEEEINAE